MKATIEFDDVLYRRLKVEAARRGRTIRELVSDAVRHVLDAPPTGAAVPPEAPAQWVGVLRAYAANADGRHDLDAMRESVAVGRRRARARNEGDAS